MEQFPCMSPHFAHEITLNRLISNPKSPLLSHHHFRSPTTAISDMSTPYTLMRCRMKDLISCFNACKVPIEEEDDELDHQKPQSSSIGDNRNVKVGSTVAKGGGEESPASWRSCESEEDDYIVFYFKDDNAGGDLIEERSLESSSERKQNAVVAGGRRRKKKDKTRLETEELNESEGLGDALGESSDSSASSFAFPRIQNEWTGSPVLMPRPEGYNKSGGVCIQCCKF